MRIAPGDVLLAAPDAEAGAQRGEMGEIAVRAKPEALARQRAHGAGGAKGAVVAIVADEPMLAEIGERSRLAAPLQIVAVRVEADARFADPARHQRVLGRAHHPDRDVGVAARQILGAVGQRKLHGNARICGAKARQQRRQHLAADDFAGGDAHIALIRSGLSGSHALQRGGSRGHVLDMRSKVKRSLGRRQASRGAREQRDAERLFEPLDAPAERRLREAEPARRARQAAFAHHLAKDPQFVPARFPRSHAWMNSRCTDLGNAP